MVKKCKHEWQGVQVCRDRELHSSDGGPVWEFKGWIATFVCHKCKKIKSEDVKWIN